LHNRSMYLSEFDLEIKTRVGYSQRSLIESLLDIKTLTYTLLDLEIGKILTASDKCY